MRLYSLDTTRMSDEEALALAEKLMEERGIEVDREHSKKHNTFRYRGIMIENHKAFLNVYNTHEAVSLEKYLHEHSEPVEVALLGGEYPISVPSDAFNAVFIGFHAAQHYGNGLSRDARMPISLTNGISFHAVQSQCGVMLVKKLI